jgi:hypothetical protein
MTRIPVDWDDDVVRQYLTPESHQKSRAEFERTHIDIDRIRAEYLFPHPTNDEFVTQEEFRDAILKSNVLDDNRIFILRGETGSGKSQLCQWLEYQIGHDRETGQDETHVALHVSRSQTRIEDIVDILTEPVGVDIQVGNVEDLDPGKVADALVTNLDAYAPTAFQQLSGAEIEQLIQDRPETDLRTTLEGNIREYQRAVTSDEEEDVPDLLDMDDYRDISLAAFGEARGGETIFPQLKGFLHDELSGKLNVGNFKEKLERISDAYVREDLRPVLICEDLTTFSVLKEQLLDHIFQLDSGHYDVVLGWTTGWEKDDLDKALGTSENTYTYMKDRAEGYLSTTDETGQAYFLTEDVTVELARKYVTAIREESERSLDVPVPETAFDGLYPFNVTFIQKAYEHLVQDGNERRTPRLLLVRIVRECLNANAPPFEAIDGNPYVKQFPTPVPIDLPAAVQSLAKWYGRPTAEGNIELPRAVFEVFDVAVPEDVLEDGESIVLPEKGGTTRRKFRLGLVEGTTEPGATVTVETTLNGRPEPDAELELDGRSVGFTDDDGRIDVTLPNEDRGVTLVARKAKLSDSSQFELGRDSLNLVATPSRPDVGEDVTITARINGETTGGIQLYKDEREVGSTGHDGTFTLPADDPPEMTIRGEIDGIEDEVSIEIREGTVYPVDVDLPHEEVDQRRFEYEQWLKTGERYDSSETLRAGAATVLEMWHDPTRLANPNATIEGADGIYYGRGSETPVSVQSVNERQGLSVELPFGTDHDDVYEPLLWCGLSAGDELPREERYELNYDLLRGWADEKVATFRSEMRAELEDCLPPGWTIEQFIVVAKFLLRNGVDGTRELDRNLVFETRESTSNSYEHPVVTRFSTGHTYRQAFASLTKHRKTLTDLAEGFFKLKEHFVDDERLSTAYEEVEANLDEYVADAMDIEDTLPDAYRVGSTRSTASMQLNTVFKHVGDYAYELNALDPSDVQYVVEAVERVDRWLDGVEDTSQLLSSYESLYEAVGRLDVGIKESWERNLERLRSGEEFHLGAFRHDVHSLRGVESAIGPDLVHLLHQYERSRNVRIEWEIFEAIDEMVARSAEVTVPDQTNKLEDAVRRSDEMTAVLERRAAVRDTIGGEN